MELAAVEVVAAAVAGTVIVDYSFDHQVEIVYVSE